MSSLIILSNAVIGPPRYCPCLPQMTINAAIPYVVIGCWCFFAFGIIIGWYYHKGSIKRALESEEEEDSDGSS